MILDQHSEIWKPCRHCGTSFKSVRWHNKEYCSGTCQRAEKRQRKRGREELLVPQAAKEVARVANPTVAQLDGAAKLLLGGDGVAGMIFVGVIPRWEPPDGVLFVEQVGTDPVEWAMMKG